MSATEKPPPPPAAVQHDPDNPPPFWCHICKLACTSAVNLHSHFVGARHRRAEEALLEGQEGEAKAEELARPYESLQEQLNACQDAEPVLGLEYVYEYRSHGNARYECRLCNCFLGRTHMFMHVVGNRHRILYLAEHHPELNVNNTSVFKKRGKKLKRLRDICVKVEEEFGRKQITVVEEEKPLSGDDLKFASDDMTFAASVKPTPAPPPLTQCVGFKQEKVKTMDFTSDKFSDAEEEPEEEEEEGVVTFQKLKAEYEASQRKRGKARGGSFQAATGGPLRSQPEKDQAGGLEEGETGESEKVQTGGPQKDQAGEPTKNHVGGPDDNQAEGPKKDQAGELEKENESGDVDEAEHKPVIDVFSGPQEVFEYLQSFEVFEMRHIHYLMKVTEKLRRVLDRHQKKVESTTDGQDEENNNQLSPADQETSAVDEDEEGSIVAADPEDSEEEPDAEPVMEESDTEPTVEEPDTEPTVEEADTEPTVEEADTEPTAESDQAAELSESQPENKNPSPFLGIKSRRSNQKLSFRISGAPAEKKSLVSSELLSNMQYKFATKGKANKMMAASVTRTDDADLSEEPMTSLEPAMDSEDSQEDEGTTMVTPTRAPYPHELLGKPSGSVNTRASNVTASSFRSGFDGTRDVQEERFPSSKPQPRHSTSKRPDRAGAAPFRDPLPNEGTARGTSSRDSYPRERLGNPNRASNKPFRNVDDFPPPKGQKSQERMRNSAPSYPTHDPTPSYPTPDPTPSYPPPDPTPSYPPPDPTPSYPPPDPVSTYDDFDPTWASNDDFDNFDDVPPPKAPKTQEPMRSSAPSHPPRDPMRTSAGSGSTRASNEPFRNDGFPPPSGPNTQERMRQSGPSYPLRDPMRTSAGSGSTSASNEPFRNDGFPPQAPNTQERMRHSAPQYPPRDPMRTSAGSASSWASNEPFRNDGFPPPSGPNTQERMRQSGPSYPLRDPMRTSAGSGSTRASNEPFRNDGFPPQAPNTQERMRHSAPQYPPRDTSAGSASSWASNEPFRNDGFPPPSAPNTQERMRQSAPQYPLHDPMRTPATWASNEPFKNAGGFPPSSAPNTQERMRNSAPPYPPREPMRTSAGPVTTWTSNEHFRNVGGFPPSSAPNTQEQLRNSAPPYAPREPMGTSAGSASTWASNEPYNNGGFAPPTAQNTQTQMRSSAPPYPQQEPMRSSAGSGFPRGPGPQETLRNPAGYSGVGPPDAYRQPGNPAPPRAPFAPPGPRASLPAFPNDEVTAKFFDSLKELDATEVTATLNKITATNPAFRGIHVPSLVRYLMETGKIRPTGNRPANV